MAYAHAAVNDSDDIDNTEDEYHSDEDDIEPVDEGIAACPQFIHKTAFCWGQFVILLISYLIMASTYGIDSIIMATSSATILLLLFIFFLIISMFYLLYNYCFCNKRYYHDPLIVTYRIYIYHSVSIWFCCQLITLFLVSTILIVSYHPYWKGPFDEIFIKNNNDNDITFRPYFQTNEYSAIILEPKSIQEIQDIIINYGIKQNLTIRAVGSGHSSSQLFTNDILISLTNFKEMELKSINLLTPNEFPSVTIGGGAILKDVEDFLFKYGYILNGFGSVQYQTVSGMLGTSVYGVYGSMNKYVNKIWIIDGNGNNRQISNDNNTNWMKAAKTSIGLLGIIYKIEFLIEPTFNVTSSIQSFTENDIKSMTTAEFQEFVFPQTINSNVLGVKLETFAASFKKQTWYNTTKDANIIYSSIQDEFTSFFNNYLLIMSCLIPEYIQWGIEMESDTNQEAPGDVYTAQSSLMQDPLFHGSFVYAVPFKNCQNALIELNELLLKYTPSYANIIPIKQNDNYGYLSYSLNEDVCMIEIYPIICSADRLKLSKEFETNILLKYNGISHWGKPLITINDINDLQLMHYNFYDDNLNLFNDIRKLSDPNGMFLNNYLRLFFDDNINNEIEITYPLIDEYRTHSEAWKVVGFYSIITPFIVSIIIALCMLFSNKYDEYLLLSGNDHKKKFWFTLSMIIFVEIIFGFIINPIVAATIVL